MTERSRSKKDRRNIEEIEKRGDEAREGGERVEEQRREERDSEGERLTERERERGGERGREDMALF